MANPKDSRLWWENSWINQITKIENCERVNGGGAAREIEGTRELGVMPLLKACWFSRPADDVVMRAACSGLDNNSTRSLLGKFRQIEGAIERIPDGGVVG